MAAQKKIKKPESLTKTGDKPNTNYRLSETVQKWAAFLVAHGCTQTEAAKRIRASGIRISQASVSKAYHAYFNEESPFPIPSLTTEELLDNSRKILTLFQIEVLYQRVEDRDWREIGLTQDKLVGALKNYEELREAVMVRDEILSLEHIMQEEELPQEALEILQARYDRLNEELKG
jgi:hypothetical protein